MTGAVNTLVGVCALKFSTTLFEVGVGLVSPATITTVASGVAVNLLLLGKSVELTCLNAVNTLNNFSSGESPARTALSLILNGSDTVTGGPVL